MTESNLSITAGASSKNVCRRSTVKDELSIVGTEEDPKIDRLIAAVGNEFVSTLNREPWRQTYSELLPGDGGLFLYPSVWPVESVSQVLYKETAVDSTLYSIDGTKRRLYKPTTWNLDPVIRPSAPVHIGLRDLSYQVDYVGGWLMPGEVKEWEDGAVYALGTIVRASDESVLVFFECTTSGTSSSSEPTWLTTVGDTTSDGSVVWTAIGAAELPQDLEQAAIIRSVELYENLEIDQTVSSEAVDGWRISYRDREGRIPSGLLTLLRNYR